MTVIALSEALRDSFGNPSGLLGESFGNSRRTPEELAKDSRRILEATQNQYRLKP
jgi:hypothetical protein